MSGLTVSQLGERVGISADAVRYYERIGILPAAPRSPSGYRLFGEADVERLRFVKRVQRLGLPLADIAELVRIRERGLCPCGHTRELLERRLATIDEEMGALGALRADIDRMLGTLPAAPDAAWSCPGKPPQADAESQPRAPRGAGAG